MPGGTRWVVLGEMPYPERSDAHTPGRLGVVKDNRHKAKMILGSAELATSYKKGILIANMESHRFAVAYHRLLRERLK
mgnify:CR=1 FL=1